MAKLPSLRRILREDVKDAPSWIERIIYPVNLFFEAVYDALNSNITFEENITCQVKDIQFVTTSAYDGTQANFPAVTFMSTLKKRAKGLLLLQLTQKADTYVAITGACHVDWLDINGTITLNLISGLTASKTYNLRVMVF